MIAQIPDHTSADLEALFNDNAAAFHNGTGGFCNLGYHVESLAIVDAMDAETGTITFREQN